MTQSLSFDGPRPIRDDEWRDSERLFRICFSGEPPEFELPAEEQVNKIDEPNAEVQVICADGRVVSQIVIVWEQLNVHEGVVQIGSIGGVSTHPNYREHRLALHLLQRCAERLREHGAEVMLISGGRGLYTRSGNVFTGKFAEFRLEAGKFPAPSDGNTAITEGFALRPARKADAEACRRLYEQQPVRFSRQNSIYEGRFKGEDPEFNSENLVIERDGEIAAYLLLHREWEDRKDPETKRRALWEAAGSKDAILAGVSLLLEGGRVNELRFPVPWQEQEMIDAVAALTGQEMQSTALDAHTMRILNFPSMLESLRPYITARLGEEVYRELRFEQAGPLLRDSATQVDEGRCAIVLGRERFELDTMQMTRLVMGDPEGKLADVEIPGWLVPIVRAIFPLPSFLPGLNYH